MGWFNKIPKHTITSVVSVNDNSIEIIAEKNAHKEVVRQAKEAQKKLDDLLEENHFTLRIYLATGGEIRKKQRKTNGH